MKKRLLLLFLAVLILRIVDLLWFKTDPVFYLSPRNFNGRGLLVMPVWIDFLIPLVTILLLFPGRVFFRFSLRGAGRALLAGLLLLGAPVVTALLLYRYTESSALFFQTGGVIVLRWLLVPFTFWAGNLFTDRLTIHRRWLRRSVVFLFLLLLAASQDLFFASGKEMYGVLALLSSPGVTTVWLIMALRRHYRQQPAATLLAVTVLSVSFTFVVFDGLSASVFTIFLPALAMAATAWALWSRRNRGVRIILAALPPVTALFLGMVLPATVAPEKAKDLLIRDPGQPMLEEQVGAVTVRFAGESLRDLAVRLGRVIDAANRLSREEFCISPGVRELVLSEYGPGGFHGEYPHRIVGRIISEEYLRRCDDAAFLADTALPVSFPDPVNGLLHEYSHLYGSVPYFRWLPGAEEEGWATYSAIVLSQLLHEKYGDSLWSPAYDYARQAEKITRRNLAGRAVVWSHPNEFGGFRLWYALARETGVKELYRKRWEATRRDLNVALMLYSNPDAARKMIRVFGRECFEKYAEGIPEKFGKLYSQEEYLEMARLTGMDTVRIGQMCRMAKERPVDPRIIVPVEKSVPGKEFRKLKN